MCLFLYMSICVCACACVSNTGLMRSVCVCEFV